MFQNIKYKPQAYSLLQVQIIKQALETVLYIARLLKKIMEEFYNKMPKLFKLILMMIPIAFMTYKVWLLASGGY